MPETIDALATRIMAAPASVVFPDTCSILDVIRSVFRLGMQGDVVSAARRLTNRAQQVPSSVWIAIPQQIERDGTIILRGSRVNLPASSAKPTSNPPAWQRLRHSCSRRNAFRDCSCP